MPSGAQHRRPTLRNPSRYSAQGFPPGHYLLQEDYLQHFSSRYQIVPTRHAATNSPVIKTEGDDYFPTLPRRDRGDEASHLYNQRPIRRTAQQQADIIIAPHHHTSEVMADRSAAHTNAPAYPTENGPSHEADHAAPPQSYPGILGHHHNNPQFITTQRNHRHGYYDSDPEAFSNPLGPYYINPPARYPQNNMASLSYESRATFGGNVDYPQEMMHDPQQQDDHNSMNRYPSPPGIQDAYSHQNMEAETALALHDMPELPQKEESDAPSPGRSKPIPKPDREVTKGEDGRFVCAWPGCTEEVRSFARKCEWSKHMDKHDRPYKCPADGCEKLPGFTYSGGLLRHQREVHNLHGGPRKQLNCPHPNCKRYSGKGFSRQENLNEHLRRVHTDPTNELPDGGAETEDGGAERAGMKRKRPATENPDIREEVAKLRKENEKLKRQAEHQIHQTSELMRQLQVLQNMVGVHALPHGPQQAPPAQMTGQMNQM